MAIGWFDFFRENGAPTWYGENRTPVVLDIKIAIILSIFITLTLAFLIILPGIRRNRCISTFTFLFNMAVGATLLVSIHHPCWHQGKVHIYSSYRSFSSARLDAVMGVSVGLRHVNITFTSSSSLLDYATSATANPPPNLNYNERFEFADVRSMERELKRSLQKGLPYPILRVIEYLSVDRAGFVWGRQYRLAGYYASILLWVAFSCWLLQFLLLCIVPHQYAQTTLWLGSVILLADVVYAINTPNHLHIRFPGPQHEISVLDFHFSTCFYSTLIAGISSIVYGSILWFLQSNTSFVFTTFLSSELDEMCVMRKAPKGVAAAGVGSPPHTVMSSCGGAERTTVMEMFAVASIRSQGSAASFQSTIS